LFQCNDFAPNIDFVGFAKIEAELWPKLPSKLEKIMSWSRMLKQASISLISWPWLICRWALTWVFARYDRPYGPQAIEGIQPVFRQVLGLVIAGLLLVWLLPLQGFWKIVGEQYRFGNAIHNCPWLLAKLYPGSADFTLSWMLTAAIWYVIILIHTLWVTLAEQYDRLQVPPARASRLTILATLGVTCAAVFVLLDCIVAKSAWSHLRGALMLAGTAASVNFGFITWSIRNSLPSRGFVLQCLFVDLPSLSGFVTITAFSNSASLNQPTAEAFVSGCTAINLLVSGIAQVILPIVDAYEDAKQRLILAGIPPEDAADPHGIDGLDAADSKTPDPLPPPIVSNRSDSAESIP